MTGRIIQSSNVIEVRQGDSFTIRLQLHKCCEPIDLTDAVATMDVKNEANKVLFSKKAEVVDAVNGKLAIILTPVDTDIPVGDYVTDIQIKMSDGSVNTIFPADVNKLGTFRVTEQVTK